GSFCTLGKVMLEIEKLIETEGAEIYPILSENMRDLDTKFGDAAHWQAALSHLGCQKPITSIVEAEPIGPNNFLDLLIIAPCSGNSLAKLANGIIDTPPLMAAKAQLRNCKPVILAISTNDGLGINAKNIGMLLNMKNIYLVPFGQDSPYQKANSLMSHMELLAETIVCALNKEQIQPILLQY
ncbi:MAG: dipicolinate synthase subunit B, partial [Clostridia bacterium]|nr:dipicolinate synthase subunit B [Clostridia bacterium]